MTLWLILSASSAIAALFLLWPFLRHLPIQSEGAGHMIAISREQLRELNNDRERGLISSNESDLAKSEIERRVLTAAQQGERNLTETTSKVRLTGIAIVVGWVVIGSAVLYSFIGRPDLPSVPPAANSGRIASATAMPNPPAVQNSTGEVSSMIADLASRLEQEPDDAEGWRMLGWSYFNTGNYQASVDAYAKAVELDASDPVILSVYGEAIVRSEGGQVSERALGVFHQALALDPIDPRARFFQGMALEQRGDASGAIALWLEILDTAPPDADWSTGLRNRVAELASATGFDLESREEWQNQPLLPPKPTAPGPTAADVAAAQEMTPEERQSMIRGMVEGLAGRLDENPDDPDGWVRLIRSYTVLNDIPAAEAALNKVRDVFGPESSDFQKIAQAASEMGLR